MKKIEVNTNCWTCNSIKNGILTVEETKAVIDLVISMRSENNVEEFYKQIPIEK